MNLSRKVRALVWDMALSDEASRRDSGLRKLAAALCACRATVAKLEAETSGQRQALLAVNRHEGLAKDFSSVRDAERTACAQLMDSLAFAIGAKAIRERK